ncbi:MAG: hypothetical protein H6739_07710 [Alphaproteobacteria bacterium]|nr:hypothetical protein [Alphaproteobacteria bacterium]
MVTLDCHSCGQPFTATRRDARTCSPSCRKRLSHRRLRRPPQPQPVVCLHCGGVFQATKPTATTCGDRCRRALSRRRQRARTRSEHLAVRFGLSSRDFWGTNPQDFEVLHPLFGFGLDAAATAEDAVVPWFISPEEDAFATEWGPRCQPNPFDGRRAVFLNPPYSAPGRAPRTRGILAWLERAYAQSQRWSLVVVVLIPFAPATRQGLFAHLHAPERGTWRRRRAFLHPDTRRPMTGNQHASCAVVFRPGEVGPAIPVYLDDLAPGPLLGPPSMSLCVQAVSGADAVASDAPNSSPPRAGRPALDPTSSPLRPGAVAPGGRLCRIMALSKGASHAQGAE